MANLRFFKEEELIFGVPPKKNFKDITGAIFGRLTVIGFSEMNGHSQWFCRCECGKLVKCSKGNLVVGQTQSCGCLNKEIVTKKATKHGCSNGNDASNTYKVWQNMLTRCRSPKSRDFKNYGGRGIKVCERWKSFECFQSDMGERLEGMSIDRIDVNGNYEPSNCRWATITEQANNKRTSRFLTHNGMTMTIREWEIKLVMKRGTLNARVAQYGWSVERALTTPINNKVV